ncbi:hypothetical protein COO60DRAFT_386760 [Scenedesmus sp. NREL 46B-D3]|nr:hypothetical protein COO60DRAFT_386760 [Scenedesmus sp. NREL 46B-D3]
MLQALNLGGTCSRPPRQAGCARTPPPPSPARGRTRTQEGSKANHYKERSSTMYAVCRVTRLGKCWSCSSQPVHPDAGPCAGGSCCRGRHALHCSSTAWQQAPRPLAIIVATEHTTWRGRVLQHAPAAPCARPPPSRHICCSGLSLQARVAGMACRRSAWHAASQHERHRTANPSGYTHAADGTACRTCRMQHRRRTQLMHGAASTACSRAEPKLFRAYDAPAACTAACCTHCAWHALRPRWCPHLAAHGVRSRQRSGPGCALTWQHMACAACSAAAQAGASAGARC